MDVLSLLFLPNHLLGDRCRSGIIVAPSPRFKIPINIYGQHTSENTRPTTPVGLATMGLLAYCRIPHTYIDSQSLAWDRVVGEIITTLPFYLVRAKTL